MAGKRCGLDRGSGEAWPLVASLGQLDKLDAFASGGQRQSAVLQRQGIRAEYLAAPAVQGWHRSAVVGGDCFEVVGRGDEFLRYLEILAALLQEHPHQFNERPKARRALGLLRDWRRRVAVGDAARYRVENIAAELAFGDAFAEPASPGERLDTLWRMAGDLDQRFV